MKLIFDDYFLTAPVTNKRSLILQDTSDRAIFHLRILESIWSQFFCNTNVEEDNF